MNIKIYTKDGCSKCKATEREFDKRGIEYEEINISHDDTAREWLLEESKSLGESTMPFVYIDNEYAWSDFRIGNIKEL